METDIVLRARQVADMVLASGLKAAERKRYTEYLIGVGMELTRVNYLWHREQGRA
jgi:hypothetical protein